MLKRDQKTGKCDTEYNGFGRLVDGSGNFYTIGWRRNSLLHGFGFMVKICEEGGLDFDEPVVESGCYR